MSQLVGLLSRRGEDVTQRLLRMLRRTQIHHDAYGLTSPYEAEHKSGLIGFSTLSSSIALGHRLIKVHPTDNPQPLLDDGRAIAFIGRLWDVPEPCSLAATNILRNGVEEGFHELLTGHEGSWVAAVAEDDAITCARDTIGSVPLYYGQNNELICISTDIKTILGLRMEPLRIKPGHILTLSTEDITDEEVAPLKKQPLSTISLDEATDELDRLLVCAVSRASRGLSSPTLAFSGGIDSTLLAYYLKRVGVRPRLTCVGSTDSPDIDASEAAANALDLPLSIKTFTEADIDDHLGVILGSVEETDPMKVGVATSLYFVAFDAATRPCRALFSGNGSDELFGGYAKYAQEYQSLGEHVRETMFRDVARSHEVNLERDWKVCSDLGLELRLPYTDTGLTRFALSLQLSHKLPAEGKEPRKIILRYLAKRLGLPKDISERPKNAAQYSSGTSKMIERLAKRRKKSVAGYLAERLEEVMRVE
jgi:asparagine synthase (glutamine-hydrolysing)